MSRRLLTLDDVAAQLRHSPRTIRRWVATGAFPPPVHIATSRRPLWRQEDVDRVAVGATPARATRGRPQATGAALAPGARLTSDRLRLVNE